MEEELDEARRKREEEERLGHILNGIILIVIVIFLVFAFYSLIRQGDTPGQAAMGLILVFVLAILLTAAIMCFLWLAREQLHGECGE